MSKPENRARRAIAATSAILALVAATLVAGPAQAAVGPQSISGQVFLGTTATTAPVGDVLVQATRAADDVPFGAPVAVDASGRYSISGLLAEGYYVHFDYVGDGGYSDTWWNEDDTIVNPIQSVNLQFGSRDDISEALNLPGSIIGHVSLGTAAVSAGAGDVSVRFRAYQGVNEWSSWSAGVLTDASGNYRIDGLPQGFAYQLHFVYLGSDDVQDAWDGVGFPSGFAVFAAQTVTRNATLPPHARLSGRVFLGTNATPAGAGDVRLTLLDNNLQPVPGVSALTDATGAYRIEGLTSGTYRVVGQYLRGSGFGTTESSAVSGLVMTQDLVLPERFTLRGTVSIGNTAHPAGAGLEVRLWTNGGTGNPQATTTTAADGSYQFAGLPPGVYQVGAFHYPMDHDGLSIWLGGYAPSTFCSLWCGTRVVADTTLNFTIPDFPGASGHVRDTQGQGIDDVTVYLHRYSTADEFLESFEVVTDAAGAWSIPVLAPGNYVLFAVDDSGAHAPMAYDGATFYEDPDVIEVTETMDDIVVNFQLPESAQLTGRVAGGPPVAHFTSDTVSVEVLVLRAGVWERTGDVWSVEGDRTYGVGQLPPGSYRFEFSYFGPKGYSSYTSGTLSFTEGQHRELNVTLPAPALSNLSNDYSGDWLADVLVRDSRGVLRAYLGNGAGRFDGSRTMGAGWNGMNALVRVGDFDGDYRSDLVARDAAGGLWLFSGNGVGGWIKATKIGTGWGAFTRLFSPGDFDGDGKADLIAGTASGALILYRGDGHGRWLGSRTIGSGWNIFNSVIPVGDFDGDGNADVITRTPNGRLYLYRGNGIGGWAGSRQIGSGWGVFDVIMSPGDFSGDGIPDVVGRTPAGLLYLYRGNGSGGWAGSAQIGSGWKGLRFVN